MAQAGYFAKKIAVHTRRAVRFHRIAKRRHRRAAVLARKALVAKARGRHLRAKMLLKRALLAKASAARAAVRARFNRRRIVQVRKNRALSAQKRARG